jgi:ABC-2 type transport system ATP-binding protein
VADAALSAHGIGKRYRLYRRRHQSLKEILVRRSLGEWEDLWALSDVSFEVPPGQFVGVIGHNGSGKSTLLKLLAQILLPDRGELTIRGRVSSTATTPAARTCTCTAACSVSAERRSGGASTR